MPPQKNTSNNNAAGTVPDMPGWFQTLMSQFAGAAQLPQAPAPAQPQGSEAPSMFVNTGYGSMMVPGGGYVSKSDLQRVQDNMPQLSTGPYGTNPVGEGVTANQFNEQYNSPYTSDLARAIGQRHPLVAQMLDNALLAPTLTKPPVDAAGNPIPTGAGFGLASAFGAVMGEPQARLAHREQLEQIPINYQLAQAQLEQERTKALQQQALAAMQLGRNPAQIAAMENRGLGAENIRANQAAQANAASNAQRLWAAMNRGQVSLSNAKTRANAQTTAAKTRANATVEAAAIGAGKTLNKQNFAQLMKGVDALKAKLTNPAYVAKSLQSGINPLTGAPLPNGLSGYYALRLAPEFEKTVNDAYEKYTDYVKRHVNDGTPIPLFQNFIKQWDPLRAQNAVPAAAPAVTPTSADPLGIGVGR